MAVGPIKFAGIAGGRVAAPSIYYMGDDNLAAWVANPANDWFYISMAIVVVMACSTLWLLHGAVSFAKSNAISFVFAVCIALGMAFLMLEGGKYDPTDLDHNMFAAMMVAAFLSTAGRLFSQKEDKEGKEKK